MMLMLKEGQLDYTLFIFKTKTCSPEPSTISTRFQWPSLINLRTTWFFCAKQTCKKKNHRKLQISAIFSKNRQSTIVTKLVVMVVRSDKKSGANGALNKIHLVESLFRDKLQIFTCDWINTKLIGVTENRIEWLACQKIHSFLRLFPLC